MAAKYVVKTGNLAAAITATVTKHDNRTTFAAYAAKNVAVDGMRYSFMAYRLSDKAKAEADKNGTELPQQYSIIVPKLDSATVEVNKLAKFVGDLVCEYQDKVLHNVADGRSEIDATDYNVLIDDYYDRSRTRDGFTQAAIIKWYDEVFSPAYQARILERNEECKKSKVGKVQTDKETTNVLNNNKPYYKTLAKTSEGLDILFIKNVKSTLEKLMELKHLDSDDAVALFMIEQADNAAEKMAQYIEMGI